MSVHRRRACAERPSVLSVRLQQLLKPSHFVASPVSTLLSRLLPIRPALALLMAAGMLVTSAAQAWTLSVGAASRRVFLHVGNGSAEANNGTINRVEVSLTGAALIGGAPQPMTTNSTQSRSLWGDGYTTCPNPASQIMIGASYRRTNSGPASATLSVSSPPNLTSASGDTIPFSEIGWSVSAPGSTTPNVIPAGNFNGAQQTLATIAANTYIENCHSFTYANSAARAAGTYDGRVTYTLTSP